MESRIAPQLSHVGDVKWKIPQGEDTTTRRLDGSVEDVLMSCLLFYQHPTRTMRWANGADEPGKKESFKSNASRHNKAKHIFISSCGARRVLWSRMSFPSAARLVPLVGWLGRMPGVDERSKHRLEALLVPHNALTNLMENGGKERGLFRKS